MASCSASLLPNGHIRRQTVKRSLVNPSLPLFEGRGAEREPLGSLPLPNVGQGRGVLGSQVLKEKDSWFSPSFSTPEKPRFFSRQSAFYAERLEKQKAPVLTVPDSSKRQGFAIHRYRSGELTGARFSTGLDSQVSIAVRSGALVTQCLTQKARTKIRRSIQNAETEFKCFMTVTFDPSSLQPWQLNSDGSVRHDFAKYKFKKYLNSISHSYSRKSLKSGRLSDRLSYVWVAEIQLKTTKNIHFHVLLNQRPPVKWLTSLWSQAKNSIDVRSINNLNHASCYLRKYMEKEKSIIQGNRYGITQCLRESMQPVKTVVNGRELQRGVFSIISDLSDTININGGVVLDHGFYIPPPCRSVPYRDSDGNFRKTLAVNAGLSKFLLENVKSLCESFPF